MLLQDPAQDSQKLWTSLGQQTEQTMRPQEVIINPVLLSPIVMHKLQCTHSAASCDIASCEKESDSETNYPLQYF